MPADRLLVWDPKDGWEPLCEFLEVDVPETPLPHVNDTKIFQKNLIMGPAIERNQRVVGAERYRLRIRRRSALPRHRRTRRRLHLGGCRERRRCTTAANGAPRVLGSQNDTRR